MQQLHIDLYLKSTFYIYQMNSFLILFSASKHLFVDETKLKMTKPSSMRKNHLAKQVRKHLCAAK